MLGLISFIEDVLKMHILWLERLQLKLETNLMNLRMKLKKASNNTYQILDKSDKVIFTFTNEDFKRLSNSQVGCAIVYY